jgi:hypothetical protein
MVRRVEHQHDDGALDLRNGPAAVIAGSESHGPEVGHRRFTLTDAVPVRLVEAGPRVRWRPGDVSGGSPSHVHRFFASSAPAVTMLRVGPVIEPCSHVYRTTPVPPQSMAPRPTSRADVAEWVDYVLRAHSALGLTATGTSGARA